MSSDDIYIKKYIIGPNLLERWLVVGDKREYMITHSSCSCRDFQLKIAKRIYEDCKHIKLMRNAKSTGLFDAFYISIQEYHNIRKFIYSYKQ